jgi:hypothetical protein
VNKLNTPSNRSNDALFQLIKSLSKAEKRNFKLFVGRNSSAGDLKIAQLFDLLDKMTDYDDALVLRKGSSIKKEQLPNLKANLYRQILASLRVMREEVNVEIQLHEQLEYARILYDKGLYQQSVRMLERTRELAKQYHQNSFWLQALVFEKKIESLHITRSIRHRAEDIAQEVRRLNERLAMVGRLSNLALQLYSWYIYYGHARDEKDTDAIGSFFTAQLPVAAHESEGFFEKLYLFQSYCWYAFISQDFLMHYRYSNKWIALFDDQPQMRRIETPYYIKGMHNLLLAHFMLRNHVGFRTVLERFEQFAASDEAAINDNVRAQTAIYLFLARLNGFFLEGNFKGGIAIVPELEEFLDTYPLQTDRHRVLVFYYKIACLYFVVGDFEKTIDYLNRIIHWKVDLRSDLQCYARLLHLIAHYELGNTALLEHLIKSVYRFMAKMENLSIVEEEIFKFIRKSFQLTSASRIKTALGILLDRLKRCEGNRFESRSFMYLDFIGWLESKLAGMPLEDVIRSRMARKKA